MKIKEVRIARGFTQNHVANLIGVRQSAVAMWENGQTVPKLEHVIKLAKVFNCSVDYILENDEEKRVPNGKQP